MSAEERLRTLEERVKPFGEHVLTPEDLAELYRLRGTTEIRDEEDFETEAEEFEDED